MTILIVGAGPGKSDIKCVYNSFKDLWRAYVAGGDDSISGSAKLVENAIIGLKSQWAKKTKTKAKA